MEIDQDVDYYKILHSERNATDEELKKSYQRLALLFHPDKVGNGEAENFHLIQKAWLILRDAESRKQYDAKLCCHENDQLLLYDTIWLSDMEFDSTDSVYTYQCRCNGVYYLDISELSTREVNISCNECTFTLKVCIPSQNKEL